MRTSICIVLVSLLLPFTLCSQINPKSQRKLRPDINYVPIVTELVCTGNIVNIDDSIKKYPSVHTLWFRNPKIIVSKNAASIQQSNVTILHIESCSKVSISKILGVFSVKNIIQTISFNNVRLGSIPMELALFDKIYFLSFRNCGKVDMGGLSKLGAISDFEVYDSTIISKFPEYYNSRFRIDSLGVLFDSKNHLPKNIEKIPKLKHLSTGTFEKISRNYSEIFAVFAKFLFLEELEVIANLDSLPQNIGNIRVKNLCLTGNKLKILPASIANISTLERIDLSYNEFEMFPTILLTMPNLKNVDLSWNKIQSFDNLLLVPDLMVQSNIESIDLSSNQLAAFSLGLLKISKLRYLDIRQNKIPRIDNYIKELAPFRIEQ